MAINIPFKRLIGYALFLIGFELALIPLKDAIVGSLPIFAPWIIGFICLGIAVYMLGFGDF